MYFPICEMLKHGAVVFMFNPNKERQDKWRVWYKEGEEEIPTEKSDLGEGKKGLK